MLINYQKANIYQDEKLVLENVDFQVNEGEFIYLIGRVGSGKSSLLKTIYCELDIDPEDAERADVLGESVLALRRSRVPALRKQMGIIFQDFQLLHDRTVYRNLRFVLKATGWTDNEKIDRRIIEVLAEVGMSDKAEKMPSELSRWRAAAYRHRPRPAQQTEDHHCRRAYGQPRPRDGSEHRLSLAGSQQGRHGGSDVHPQYSPH